MHLVVQMNPNLIMPMILLSFLLMKISPNLAFSIAKPGCEDHCGNVSIPFPFGTREGCYLNSQFLMTCRNSSGNVHPPQLGLYVYNSKIPVKDISLGGQYRVLYDVGYDCYDQNNHTLSDKFRPWMTLGGFPIAFNSTVNKFTAIGCDTSAAVEGEGYNGRTYFTGCMSFCNYREDVLNGSCSGIGCCQTSIPNGARQINISMASYFNHSRVSEFNPCSYSFLVEDSDFQFFSENLTNIDKNSRFPVVVDWVVATNVSCGKAKTNQSSYACKTENSECYDDKEAIGYRCRCKDGFEGNPYLPVDGCHDVNECESFTLHNCANGSTCVNTPGGYTCRCNQGYHGNGGKDGKGCIADQRPPTKNYWPIFAGVGVSIVSAIFVAFSFCLYSLLMRRKEDRLRVEYYRKNGGFLLQQKLPKKAGGSDHSAIIFTVEQLQKATNNFDENLMIGQGGFGTVYKGELADKTIVAIKKSKGVDHRQVEQFINEVALLSQISRRNVVKLLGCCLETEVPLLVYEFINNGTLFEHIHNKLKVSKLSWNIRLRIASEIAGALSYLHSVALPPICWENHNFNANLNKL